MATITIAELLVKLKAETADYKRGFKDAREAADEFRSTSADLSKQMDSSGLKWTEMASKISVAKEAFGMVAEGAKIAYGAMKEGADLELARMQFDNLAVSIGTTSDALLNDLGGATAGMMSNADMIESASDIISLGLADNQKDVVDLSTLVSNLGWDMQQVIMTFANNSKARLDALGLSVEDVNSRMEALKKQGYDTDRAFDLAVIQAGQAKLELLGSAADTAVGDIARMEAAWADLNDTIKVGTAHALAPAVENASNLVGQMGDVGDSVHQANNPLKTSLVLINEFNKAVGGYTIPAVEDWINGMENHRRGLELTNSEMGAWEARVQSATAAIEEAAAAESELAEQERLASIEKLNSITVSGSYADSLYDNAEAAQAATDAAAEQAAVYRAEQEELQRSIEMKQAWAQATVDAARGPVAELMVAHEQMAAVYPGDAAAAEEAQERMAAANAAIAQSYQQAALDIAMAKISEQYGADALAAQEAFLGMQVAMGTLSQEEADKLLEVATNTQMINDVTTELMDKYLSDGVLVQEEQNAIAEAVSLIGENTGLTKDEVIAMADESISQLAIVEQSFIGAGKEAQNVGADVRQMHDDIAQLPKETEITFRINTIGSIPNVGGGGGSSSSSSDGASGYQEPGFASGGYVPGTEGVPAGIVHGQEFVFDAPAVRNIGLPVLEDLRSMAANGGGGTSISFGDINVAAPANGNPVDYGRSSRDGVLSAARGLGLRI